MRNTREGTGAEYEKTNQSTRCARARDPQGRARADFAQQIALGCGGCVRAALADLENALDLEAAK